MSRNFHAVLILGASGRVAIPIARVLRKRCGVPVDVASLFPEDPVLHSRAIRGFVRLPSFRSDPLEFSNKLLCLIHDQQIDTIFATQDLALAAISANYDALTAVTHVGCPSPCVLERVLNKAVTLRIAQQCGIRVPQSKTVSSAAEAEMIAGQLHFPLVLKPAETGYAGRLKSARFQSPEKLIGWLREHNDGRRFLLQEYCQGEGVGIEMLLHNGQPLATFQHRRLKEQPPSGGVAVTAIAEKPDPFLVDASVRLLRALEWEGVAMVEFRQNRIDGTAALMEVNGRFWGTTALPLMAGVEFPVYYWQLLHGHVPEPPREYLVGMRWRWTGGYLERTRRLFSRSRRGLSVAPRWKELADIPFDLSPALRDAIWCSSDPLPALNDIANTCNSLLKDDWQALMKTLKLKRSTTERPLNETALHAEASGEHSAELGGHNQVDKPATLAKLK